MSEQTKIDIAILKEKFAELERDKNRSSVLFRALLLFVLGLIVSVTTWAITLQSRVVTLETKMEVVKTSVANQGKELGNIHNKIEKHEH